MSKCNTGLVTPAILLPSEDIDLTKWAVVACDQYTSQPEYWKSVEKLVQESPSTLHMILPEVYLEEDCCEERIEKINKTMENYLLEGVLVQQKPGFVYIDRQTTHAASRKGLVAALDLEKYDYNKGSQTPIRATEGTVLERLPPRIKIRENAPVELPHIMVLIDDPDRTVIEPVAQGANKLEKLYDIDLMMGGKHIKGYRVDEPEIVSQIYSSIHKLADPVAFQSRYQVSGDKGVLLFAVGDGNHSLASAKAHWENIKKTLNPDEQQNHPARFALVEIVNVHDGGIKFEPIHRVVFNINPRHLLAEAIEFYGNNNSNAYYRLYESGEEMNMKLSKTQTPDSTHIIPFVSKGLTGLIFVENTKSTLTVGTLQAFLDYLVSTDSTIKVDYIHGEDVVTSLGTKEGNMGFYLPVMNKHDLFKTVILDGVLPRKTFSMGDAEEKRFYLECRKIVK